MDIDNIVQTLECLVWLGFMVAMIIVGMRKRKQPEQNGSGQPPPADNLDRPITKSGRSDTVYVLTALGLVVGGILLVWASITPEGQEGGLAVCFAPLAAVMLLAGIFLFSATWRTPTG